MLWLASLPFRGFHLHWIQSIDNTPFSASFLALFLDMLCDNRLPFLTEKRTEICTKKTETVNCSNRFSRAFSWTSRARHLVTGICTKSSKLAGSYGFKMAEVKVRNLLRLSRLRDKYDAVILATHACLVERGYRCIGCGEEVSSK